jgi:large subunit ribosomal protein L1
MIKKKLKLNNNEQGNSLEEVIQKIKIDHKENSKKFNESLDIVLALNINPKKENIRGSCVLPYGSGKTVKVAAFVEGADIALAQQAGADIIGDEDLINKIKNGETKFDVQKCIATPSMMLKLTKIASILGKRGLMPNIKDGTIVADVSKIITEIKKGLVFLQNDSAGYIHASVGKMNFDDKTLIANTNELINTIKKYRKNPKGLFIKKIYLNTTMGKSFPLNIN